MRRKYAGHIDVFNGAPCGVHQDFNGRYTALCGLQPAASSRSPPRAGDWICRRRPRVGKGENGALGEPI